MTERLIWQPNEFTRPEWEKLSREQQIQWWTDHEANKPRKPPHPLKVVQGYERGALTRISFASIVLERLTEENVAEFFTGCSPELLEILRIRVREMPADDDEQAWRECDCIFGGTVASLATKGEFLNAQQEISRQFREGVRIFRVHDHPKLKS